MQVPLLDLKKQFEQIRDEVMPAINRVCQEQALCLGPAVDKFEKEIALYCESKYAIGVSSGTDALLVALMALGIKPGDEIIVPAFTFVATTGAVARVGAVPVFVDIDEKTFNIDPTKIEEKITDKTRAIIPVHLFGQLADMKPIMSIAKKYNLSVIEDAAQSIGASQDGIKCGNFGDFGCFSFYPTKNLGAFGDGGLITTNNQNLDNLTRMVRNHGQNATYEYQIIGGNFRLDGIQGAVLSVKLNYLDQWSNKRRENAEFYNEAFADLDLETPYIAENNHSIYNQYTIKCAKRDALQAHLRESEVGCGVYYPFPLHLQKCFAHLNYKEGDLPITDKVCKEVLSLPISPELTTEQRDFVVETVRAFFK